MLILAFCRFNYGEDGTGTSAFAQMMPITTFDNAIPDFLQARNSVLATMPAAIAPLDLVRATFANNYTVFSGSPTCVKQS